MNYSLYAMLAKHIGHSIAVLPIDDVTEQFPGWVPNFPDEPERKHNRNELTELPITASITASGRSHVFPLGHVLAARQRSVLFTGYFDQAEAPELSPVIWHFLARHLWQPLVVEAV